MEGHVERAWILPLGFTLSPLGPQNSNDFLFSISNMVPLTRILMKVMRGSISRDKQKVENKCTLFIIDYLYFICKTFQSGFAVILIQMSPLQSSFDLSKNYTVFS